MWIGFGRKLECWRFDLYLAKVFTLEEYQTGNNDTKGIRKKKGFPCRIKG